MKILGIAAATAIALAPVSVVVTASGVAQAAPCSGQFANPASCENCLLLVERYHTPNVCDRPPPSRPAQAPTSTMPVQIPEAPPLPPLPEPAPQPAVPSVTEVVPSPSTIPAQTPKIKPMAPETPRNASAVTPPKGLDAPPQAIAAAKAAPATRVNPGINQMLQLVDFNHQVQTVVDAHNVDVMQANNQALARPRHWDYIDYDAYHRPILYNPLDQAMTFRYFYNGAYRESYVPAGGRIVLDAATVGVFPFTAVGDSYLASGSFYGGAWIPPPNGWDGPPPPDYKAPAPRDVYEDVVADVAADDQNVEVGRVEVVGHDDRQPAGSQDTFLLDDTTFAWGQINDPSTNAQIRVTKTQSLPGVGPTDNGSFLVALANYKEPQPSQPWWPSALVYGLLAVAVCFLAWMISREHGARI